MCDEQSVNCVMNKLGFETNNCDLCIYMSMYIYVYISVRSVYIYLCDLCISVLRGLCCGIQTGLGYRRVCSLDPSVVRKIL